MERDRRGLRRRIPRLIWLVVSLIIGLTVINGGIIYGRQATAQRYACLQVRYDRSLVSPTTTFDLDSGTYFGLPTPADDRLDTTWQMLRDDISSDGQYVAYVLSSYLAPASLSLWVKPNHAAGGLRPLFIHDLNNAVDFGWIPDTHSIVYRWKLGGEATMIGVTDVSIRQTRTAFLTTADATLLGPSADGLYIAFKILPALDQKPQVAILSTQTLQTVVTATGLPMVIGTPDGSAEAVWSPQRHRLAFLLPTAIQDEPELHIVSPGDTDLIFPLHLQGYAPGIHWSPDSRYLVFESKTDPNWQLAVMGTESGGDFQISDQAGSLDYSYPEVRWSADNQRLYYNERSDSGAFNLIALNMADRSTTTLAADLLGLPSYSSDDQHTLVESLQANVYHFSVVDLQSGGTTLIGETPLQDNSTIVPDAAWSPDGKTILVQLPDKLVWTAADGSNSHELANVGITDVQQLQWSKDGQSVVYAPAFTVGSQHVYMTELINLTTGERHELGGGTQVFPGMFPAPDGKVVSIISQNPGNAMILQLVSADGTWTQTLSSTAQQQIEAPAWAPDGSRLAYLTISPKKPMVLDVVTPDGTSILHFDGFPLEYSQGARLRWTHCN